MRPAIPLTRTPMTIPHIVAAIPGRIAGRRSMAARGVIRMVATAAVVTVVTLTGASVTDPLMVAAFMAEATTAAATTVVAMVAITVAVDISADVATVLARAPQPSRAPVAVSAHLAWVSGRVASRAPLVAFDLVEA